MITTSLQLDSPPLYLERAILLSPNEMGANDVKWSISWDAAVAAEYLTTQTSQNLEELLSHPDTLFQAQRSAALEVWDGIDRQWRPFTWNDTLRTSAHTPFFLIQHQSKNSTPLFSEIIDWINAEGFVGTMHVI